MQEIKTLNKIDPVVNGVLKGYAVSDDAKEPVGILVRSAKLHDMEFPESLLAIARAGAGVNNIPLDRCAAEGICVFNTPGANANAVKELVFAAIMMVNRNLVEAIDWCKGLAGDPDAAAKVEKGKNQFVGPELAGKTMGVIGLGDIGVRVANEAYALGMNVIGFDPFISVDHAWKLSRAVEHADSLDYLIRNSDFITIHVPLNDKTRGYFGEKELAACKPTAVLVNFSRDPIVDIPPCSRRWTKAAWRATSWTSPPPGSSGTSTSWPSRTWALPRRKQRRTAPAWPLRSCATTLKTATSRTR